MTPKPSKVIDRNGKIAAEGSIDKMALKAEELARQRLICDEDPGFRSS